MENSKEMCYNEENRDELHTLREKVRQTILSLTDEQAEYVWRWLMCSKPENN